MNPSSKSLRPQILRRSKVVPESTQFCSYSHRVCMQMRLEGYDHCARHILEDKNSPFKQCQYMSNKTSKRCTSAALRNDKKEGYCPEHARRAAQLRFRAGRKRRPKETPELLLEELEHYTPRASGSNGSEAKKSRSSESASAKIIELMSSSDSEVEALTVEQTWRGDGDSDAESVDSEQEDPLKHAGVYTAEEVALITRDKLIRLQSLYIDQFKRLQHVMKEKRRRYLHTVSREREILGSIRHAKDDPAQRSKYDELVAMKRYHKRFGQEALLHRQSKERRIAVSEGINYKPPSYPKCILSSGSGRCGARTVPLSKYCLEHMLQDPHQILYTKCNYAEQCKRPILPILKKPSCGYHILPDQIDYRLPKKEEKDESKEEIDVVGGTDTKPEDPHQSLQLQRQLKRDKLKQDASATGSLPSMQQEKLKQGASTTGSPTSMQQEQLKQEASTTGSLPSMQQEQLKQDASNTCSLPSMQQENTSTVASAPTKPLTDRKMTVSVSSSNLQESDKKSSTRALCDLAKADTETAKSQPQKSSGSQSDSFHLSPSGGESVAGTSRPSELQKPVQSAADLSQVIKATVGSDKSSASGHVPSSVAQIVPISQDKTSSIPSPILNVRCSSLEKTTSSPELPTQRISPEKRYDLPLSKPGTLPSSPSAAMRSTSQEQMKVSSPVPVVSSFPREVPQVVSDLLVMEKELDQAKQSHLVRRQDIILTKTPGVGGSRLELASISGLPSGISETKTKTVSKSASKLQTSNVKTGIDPEALKTKFADGDGGNDEDDKMADSSQSQESINVSMDTT